MLLSGRRRCLAVPVIVALLAGLLPIGAAVAAVAALPKTIIVPGLVAATIQGGINIAASGDTVLVRPGVYHELLNFKGKSVRVVSQGGPATTTIDGGVGAPVVTFTSGEPSSTLLQGFTITDGIAGPFTPGGGIAVHGSSPTIFGNIITKNTTCGGGPGIEVQFGAPVIVANIVSHNRDGCNNFLGGAIEVFGGTAEIISNRVELNDNQTGIVIRAGLTPSVVANNIIEKNTGLNTRGLSATGNVLVLQNLIVGNTQGIAAAGDVAGIPFPTIVNNTVANNLDSQLALATPITPDMQIVNNIFAGSFGSPPVICGLAVPPSPPAVMPTFSHNDLWSPSTPTTAGPCPTITGANGNISADPGFTPSLQLGPGSPGVDSGTNNAPDLPAPDIAGQPRLVDATAQGVATIDMGAFERQAHPYEPPIPNPPVLHVPSQYPTIQAAVVAANDGAVIQVAPGTYAENLDFDGKDVVVESTGGAAVTTIDGAQKGPTVSFHSGEPRSAVLQGFTITHGGPGILITGASPSIVADLIQYNIGFGGAGISFTGDPLIAFNMIEHNVMAGSSNSLEGIYGIGSAPIILANVIAYNQGGIDIELSTTALIADNAIAANRIGLRLQGETGAEVIQNVIVDGEGITISNPLDSTGDVQTAQEIVSNTIVDTFSGIEFSFKADEVTVADNIVSGPNPAYCSSLTGLVPSFSHNDLHAFGTPVLAGDCASPVGTNGNIGADPLFSPGTFAPAPGSPAIDGGTVSAPFLPATDIQGAPRVAGNAVDIGAYEYQRR
jgi:hypothetical protein